MVLHPTQNKVAESSHRFRVINCGRRWGKTTLAVEEMKGRALAGPANICYIAPTIQQARDIAWEILKKEMLPVKVDIKEAPELKITVKNIKGSTSTIKLRGWEAVETLRGQSFDLLVIDEVASMRNFWVGWQEVLRPTLTDRKGHAIFISTPKGFNHFHVLFKKEAEDQDYKSFHFTSYDNPHIDGSEIDKAKAELAENEFAQEYLADFRKVEGLVYNLPDELVVDPLPENARTEARIMGVDWGYRNPAAIWVGYEKDKVWQTNAEWKATERTTAEIIQVIQNLVREHRVTHVYPDPAEPDRIEECRRAGIPVFEANKDIEGGVSYIQNLIRQKRFKVSNKCIYTLEELNTYQYPEGVDGKPLKDVPEKLNDHMMDAMRYALYSYQPISTIQMASTPVKSYYPELGI